MAIRTNVTELPESRVRVQAEVPAEEVERRIQQAAKALGRQLRIPGFRKGKVPPPVVIHRLGRETVLDEALRSSLGGWYVEAIDDAGIAPVGEPDLDVGDLPGGGEPLAFSIEIGVRPPAKLGDYKGLEVGRREPHVDDARLEEQLEALRDRFATLETVQRAAVHGDHVVIDYLGTIDAKPFEGGEGRDQLLELGSGRLLPGFEEQLTGAQAGERRTVQVSFPEDYPRLGGQEARFEVTVSEVKAKQLAELDDEFAVQAAGMDTLAELREDIARRLEDADRHAIEEEFEQAVLDAAVAEAEVDVPERLIHARAHEMLEQMLASLARQGIPKETYLQITGKDEEVLAHDAEPDAAAALRREAVLAAIVQAEAIEPSDEQVLEALAPAAEREGVTAQELMGRLQNADRRPDDSSAARTGEAGRRPGRRLERVREDLAARQALELLVREAKPISVEQAKARNKLWTPGGEPEPGAGQLWTPGR